MSQRENRMIQLTAEEKKQLVEKLSAYLDDQFDLPEPPGNLKLTLLLNFITEQIAPVYYNKAVEDARTYMADRLDDLYLLMR